jgi:hypothetical protein
VVWRVRPTETVRNRQPRQPLETQRNTVLRSGRPGSMSGTRSRGIRSVIRGICWSLASITSRKPIP